MEEDERKNEVETKSSVIKEININLYEVCKSVCKIINKKNLVLDFLLNYIKEKRNYFD